jgi:hypothetical protein
MLISQTNFRPIFLFSALNFFAVAAAMPVKFALKKEKYNQKF